MKLVRLIDTQRCTGCRACIAACAVENYLTPGSPWNLMIEFERGTAPETYRSSVTMNCMHCERPPCQVACDGVGAFAISKNAGGVVLVHYDKCTGCGCCAAACPYGVPQINSAVETPYPFQSPLLYERIPDAQRHWTHRKRPKVMEKCTFCWHRIEPALHAGKAARIGKDRDFTPACDLVCPADARLFGDLDDPDSDVAKAIRQRKAGPLNREFGTGVQVYYVLEDEA